MRLKEFRNKMQKGIFSWEEAMVVAFDTAPATLKLQLHNWKKSGDVVSLKRGVYIFSGIKPAIREIAIALYSPCYISMEYALNYHGLIPDIPFAITLVTTKTTRTFNTRFGRFLYQKIKKLAFTGYDMETLVAEKEKAVVDYLYLNRHKLIADMDFWENMRWQNLETINFKKAFGFADCFGSTKLIALLKGLKKYAGTSKIS